MGPGGCWNPRLDFEEILGRQAPQLTDERLAIALDAGDEFLATADGTPSRDDYHRVMLSALGVDASPALLAKLDAPLNPAAVVEPFPR